MMMRMKNPSLIAIFFLAAARLLFQSVLAFSIVGPVHQPRPIFPTNTNAVVSKSASLTARHMFFKDDVSMIEEELPFVHTNSPTLVSKLAYLVTAQLVQVLQKEQDAWKKDTTPTSIRIKQMTRFLNTRLLFGSSALEVVQAAAAAKSSAPTMRVSFEEESESQQSRAISTISDAQTVLDALQLVSITSSIQMGKSNTVRLETINEPALAEAHYHRSSSSRNLNFDSTTLALPAATDHKSYFPSTQTQAPTCIEILDDSPKALANKSIFHNIPPPLQVVKSIETFLRKPWGPKASNKDTPTSSNVNVVPLENVPGDLSTNNKAKDASSPPLGVDIVKDTKFDHDQVANVHEKETVIEIEITESQNNEVALLVDDEQDELVLLRQQAANIAHSFQTKEFQPAWFAKNPHFQTLTGVFARQESMYLPALGNLAISRFQWDERRRMETPDGDFFDVDWKYAKKADDEREASSETPLVLICHGLQSNSESPLVKDMVNAFNNIGMDAACLNFRGCSGEVNRTPLGYHLSFTDDLKHMVEHIATTRPGTSIYLSGFSLGANVVTKYLADLGEDAVKLNIRGAAVNAVPFDLIKVGPCVSEPGLSKSLYGDKLLQSLMDRTLESLEVCEYSFSEERLQQCTTLKEYDDLVVCSIYDFENVDDYHRKSSTYDMLDKVMVPQLIIQALDDPFFQGNTNPSNDFSQPLRIQYTEHGGHCGFVFHSTEEDRRETSWLPTEMARFIEHAHETQSNENMVSQATRESSEGSQGKQPLIGRPKEVDVRRGEAARISHSFQTREFSPEWYATNEHFQTILGSLYRRETMYTKSKAGILRFPWANKSQESGNEFQWDERQRMETPDGDFFDVDWKYCDSDECVGRPSDEVPLVLICHGLQSDSTSPLIKDMTMAFNSKGMDAACINFRGCSGEINRTPVGYHLGFTDDLKQMIKHVNKLFPSKRIYLSGFSLGANVVTTCLAEMGDTAYDHNICGAAVNAVPFDMVKGNLNLNEDGITKSIYGSRLLQSMIDRIEESYDTIDFSFPREKARECKTIMDVENLLIAPVFGFEDAWDYYEKCSSLDKIDRVSVPQLVVQAKDDPFFRGQTNPQNDPNRPLRIHYTEYGGHCGYVFHSKEEDSHETSWMPTELARFLSHLEQSFSPRVKDTLSES
jgi:predicted alpha/beta-fold hydrolase